MDKQKTEQTTEYAKPQIADYGDLQELTASHVNSGITDVPKGIHGPHVFSVG